MHRTDFQTLADLRAVEAKALRNLGHREGAYYLLGYAVECALKACISQRFREHDLPDKRLVLDAYTHNLEELLRLAGLKPELDNEVAVNAVFRVNWNVAKEWKETARYTAAVTQESLDSFFAAVLDGKDGVLPWLKKWW